MAYMELEISRVAALAGEDAPARILVPMMDGRAPPARRMAHTARRGFARACLDWTERRHHVAGPLGTLLFKRFLELGWIARIHDGRAVRLTHRGRLELEQQLRLRLHRT